MAGDPKPGAQAPLTRAAWQAAAVERYGANAMHWRFRCPVCRVETNVSEWKEAKAPEGAIGFSCIGRYTLRPDETPPADESGRRQPCNYAGGGLFKLNPVRVVAEDGEEHAMFDFADRPLCEAAP